VKQATEDILGPDALYVPKQANLGGEDFSFFAEKVPSAYYQLGTTAPGKPYYPVHHGKMVPDEKALSIGMEVMVNCALKFLNS
jgi:amidohydrolase